MLLIGSHVSFKKDTQLLGSVEEALSYKANAFMFYTGAPQNTARSPIEDGLTLAALTKMQENNINLENIIVHAPYIINLAQDDSTKFKFAVDFLEQEIRRVEQLGCKYLVLHPGSHVGIGIDKAIENIAKGLNMILMNKTTVTILLETMAGKGTEVASKLEEIKRIIDLIDDKSHLGVCLDTCHLSDAGYNIQDFDRFLDDFDKIIGIDKINCLHLNDSKNESSTHKDRHENLGFGHIGYDTLINIAYNKRLENIPKILETPYVDKIYPPYKYEIAMIRNKKFDSNLITKIKEQV